MAEFSTTSILRLARLAAERLGTSLPGGATPRGARASLTEKRALATALLAAHGPIGLLSVSDCIGVAPDDAIALALRPARDMTDLLDRWARLEAYVHSRHRVRAQIVEPGQGGAAPVRGVEVAFVHVSLVESEPPLAVESLLVAGVLVGLAEQLGLQDLEVDIGGDAGVRRRAGRWSGAIDLAAWRPAVWTLRWSPGPPGSVSAGDASAGDASARGASAAEIWLGESAATDATDRLSRRLRRDVLADPARRWTVGEVARRHGLSARSLQRRLQAEETRFSDVVGDARVAAAARLLVGSAYGTAEIGFASGFADQAHFSRAYKRATAFSPAAYRAAFAAAPAAKPPPRRRR